MAHSRLSIYNITVLRLGERALDSLDEDRESRHALDEVYTRGRGAVRFFMEKGHWNFAMRAVKIDADSSVDPEFGFANAFSIPTDYTHLNMISTDERFTRPLNHFEEEGQYWFTDIDPLYVRYVSDGNAYGGDLSQWTENFAIWTGTWLALQIGKKILNDDDYAELKKDEKRLMTEARSLDASNEPTRFFPLSSWATARLNQGSRRDRGSRSKLIG